MTPTDELDQFLTAADVARIYQVRAETVRDWARTGFLPSFRIGRRLRFSRQDVDAILRRVTPALAAR